MPSATNCVGPLLLPVPAGAQDSALDDPTLGGLLAYFGHWLRVSLDDKFASLRGTAASIVGACPTTARFPWDPSTYFVRGNESGAEEAACFPALYMWRIGRGARVQYSTLKSMRKQSLGIAYIFDELSLPGGWEARSGLLGAIDAVLWSAVEWGYHPTFGLDGGPVGTPIAVSLSLSGHGLQYDGGEQGIMGPVPGQTRARGAGADGHMLRGYPVLRGQMTVWEMIEQAIPVDPTDVTPELLVTIKATTEGGIDDALEIMQRVLPAPDGTETIDP